MCYFKVPKDPGRIQEKRVRREDSTKIGKEVEICGICMTTEVFGK